MKTLITRAHRLFNADLVPPAQPSQQKTSPSEPASELAESTVSSPPRTIHLIGMSQDEPSTIQEPSALDILRYRYHHAANLGSVYVLERWLSPSRFPEEATGSSELEAVKAWVAKIGPLATKGLFEEAWESAVSDADIEWLTDQAKCTTIRLPIGYWNIPGEEITKGTPFEPYCFVYTEAWSSICRLISRLRSHSIGVIIDFHALPGGANTRDHSGTNSGVSGFFTSVSNRQLGLRCIEFVAQEAAAGLEIAGLQLVNEPDNDSMDLYEWYNEALEVVSSIDPGIPVVISDAWDLGKAVEYSLGKNLPFPEKPTCPVLVDTHLYWCFTDMDRQKTPQEIIRAVPNTLSQLDGKQGSVVDRGAVQVIVGEYSNVMPEQSWVQRGEASKEELVKMFGASQSVRYQDHAAGAFFWTWKMDWMPGGEWGFKAQSDPENRFIFPPRHAFVHQRDMFNLLVRARSRKDERMYKAIDQHHAYYDHLSPNEPSEHWLYESGWKLGYQDAYAFFEGKDVESVRWGNKIGNLELWVLKRVRESGFRGRNVWEFEQGLRRGVNDFNAVVGI